MKKAMLLFLFLLMIAVSFISIHAMSNDLSSNIAEDVVPEPKVTHSLNETMIVFTFDDGKNTDYSIVYPLMQSRGFKSTHYIIASHIGYGDYMTWDQVQEMSYNGFDIECHTFTHANLNELNDSEIENQLVAVNKEFMEHGLPYPKHIAYPYGANPVNNTDVISKYRLTGRNVNAFEINYISSANYGKLYSISSYPIEYGNKTEQIDKAIEGNYTLVFCLHGVSDNPDAYDINITEFETVLDYIEEKNIPVVTMAELYDILESEGYVNSSEIDCAADYDDFEYQETTIYNNPNIKVVRL